MTNAFAKNLQTIHDKIQKSSQQYAQKNNIKSHNIKLIAVSKYHSTNEILALHKLGQCDFGENKVQDLKQKIDEIHKLEPCQNVAYQSISQHPQKTHQTTQIKWHFIGSLQKNKINALLALKPTLIHSIDSISLAKALNDRCAKLGIIQNALLQVNSANEPSKHGFSLSQAKEAFLEIKLSTTHLNLCGIMTIGAHSEDIGKINESFARTKELYDSLASAGASVLSMGMSGDFELAIQNGANMLRIGSALFNTK